jgi:hypothetical protein
MSQQRKTNKRKIEEITDDASEEIRTVPEKKMKKKAV